MIQKAIILLACVCLAACSSLSSKEQKSAGAAYAANQAKIEAIAANPKANAELVSAARALNETTHQAHLEHIKALKAAGK